MSISSKIFRDGSVAVLAIAIAVFSSPAWADGSPECNINSGPDGIPGNADDPSFSTECGVNSSAQNERSLAVGAGSTASGYSSIAIGTNAAAREGGSIAIGTQTEANGFTSIAIGGRALGAGSTATGDGSAAAGQNSSVYGSSARAGGDGGISDGIGQNIPNTFENANATALGYGAQAGVTEAGQNNTTAVGALAKANANNSSAFGAGSKALFDNSVALGQGSETDRADSVSVGHFGAQRQVTNVAAGTEATDAVNMAQLDTVATAADTAQGTANLARTEAASAQNIAAAAQGTADTARSEAASAQTTANTAIVRGDTLGASTASALGGGSTYSASTGAVSAPSYTIDGQRYSDVGSAFEAVDNRIGQIGSSLEDLRASTDRGFREANAGIAAAIAMGGTMIVPDSTVSVNFNLATYRGEQGFSGVVVVRAAPRVYLSGGFAGSTVKGSGAGRVGMAFGF